MEVRDKDLADLARLDGTLLKLDLRALATVEYPDTAVILTYETGDIQGGRRTMNIPN